MKVKKFTAISVEALKPQLTQYEATDGSGLRLIIFPSGKKTWCLRYRKPNSGRPAKLVFGKWPSMTLAQARVALEKARLDLDQGIDPAGAKQEAKAAAEIAKGDTLRAIAEQHLRYEESKPTGKQLRTIDQRRSTFERLIFPVLGGRPIHEIKRSEIVRLLDHIEAARGPRAADEALSVLNIVYGWAVLRHENLTNPIIKSMRRTTPKGRMRTRVLDNGELRKVWIACEGLGAFGAFIRFLLLTATRRNESARATWSEVVNGIWRIPAERFKSEREHVVPLSRAAQDLLASVPVISGCDFIFTNDGQRAIGGFSAAKRKLDQASGVVGWRLHDLRRVSRSLLSRAKVSPEIAERCLGHSVGGHLGKTYDQHNYHGELALAFEALAREIDTIINPPDGNVITLRR
jgi:integrase